MKWIAATIKSLSQLLQSQADTLLVLLVLFNECCAADAALENLPLYGEFKIGTDGRLILLPVVLDQQELLFMLDTGSCRTAFDVSLRDSLGEKKSRQLVKTHAGNRWMDTYAWPSVTLSNQKLKSDRTVICSNLADFRNASGEKIYGILGMDVLRNCQLQVNFDEGTARFLKSLPAMSDDLGRQITIQHLDCGVPSVEAAIADQSFERFVIDTGAHGNSLQIESFDKLRDTKIIRIGGAFASVTAGGAVEGQRGYLRELTVGGFVQKELRFSRTTVNTLGLRFLSRFVVTFDFPGSMIYLKPGVNIDRPEPQATSGMNLEWRDGKVTVTAVKADSPAQECGIRVKDNLEAVNGIAINQFDHFSLRQLLTSEEGKKVSMRIRRADVVIDIVLTLISD